MHSYLDVFVMNVNLRIIRRFWFCFIPSVQIKVMISSKKMIDIEFFLKHEYNEDNAGVSEVLTGKKIKDG